MLGNSHFGSTGTEHCIKEEKHSTRIISVTARQNDIALADCNAGVLHGCRRLVCYNHVHIGRTSRHT